MDKKESWAIIIAILTMTIILYFPKLLGDLKSIGIANSFIISGLVIIVGIYTKILVAKYIDVDVKFKTWEFQRFWITAHAQFKKPIPIGVVLPVIISFFSNGHAKLLTLLQYDSHSTAGKLVKKYGMRRFSNIMEWDDALIVFYSMVGIFFLAILAKVSNNILPTHFFSALSQYSLYYALANLIPFSNLDGMKLAMGSRQLYIFTLILLIITALIVFF